MKKFMYLFFLCFFVFSKGYGVEMEFQNFLKLANKFKYPGRIPIAFVFDQKNNIHHFEIIDKKEGEYLIINKKIVNSWANGNKHNINDSFNLKDLTKFIKKSTTKKNIKTLSKSDVKYKIIFFNAWSKELNQYQKLVANKKKRQELFSLISAEENDIKVLEINLDLDNSATN